MSGPELASPGEPWRDVADTDRPVRRGIFIAIDNADNRLTQEQWALFISRTRYTISSYCTMAKAGFLAEWHAPADAIARSACWLVEEAVDPAHLRGLSEALCASADQFQPDGIGWSHADLDVLRPVPVL